MNGFKRYVGLSALLFPVITAIVSGCGSDASTGNPQEDVKVQVDAPSSGASNGSASNDSSTNGSTMGSGSVDAPVQDFGLYRGTWDGKELKFEPIEEATGGIRTQSFTEVDFNRFTITTTAAIAVNNQGAQCTANASSTYFTDGVSHPFNGGSCANHTLCAVVNIENPNTRTVENIWAEITSITPAGFAGNNSDDPNDTAKATGPEYGLSSTLGLWWYGTQAMGYASDAQWNFDLPSCADFTFTFRLKGTLSHNTGYNVGAGTQLPSANFLDACALGGTVTLQNSSSDMQTLGIPMPFPFSLYDLTLDTSNLPLLYISEDGALGIADGDPDNLPGVATGANTTLPAGYPYTIYAFWDDLSTGASGVCYTVTGSAPNRKFVVTWKDATIVSAPTQKITFSAVLNEGSDNIDLQYKACSINAAKRGGGATIGIEGLDENGNSISKTISANAPYIPSTCAGNGYAVKLSPKLPSTL